MITVDDIDAELSKPDRGKRTSTQNVALLLLSLGLFAATGLLKGSWMSVIILVIVLFIHESGHWLGMKLYGYRNLQMFFIPFFGAAVTGKELNVSGSRRAIVSLLGPAPGIILGIICGLIYLKWKQPVILQFGLISVLINGFNLFPIFPLDGGRFMETVIFSRHPVVEIVFKVLAALALAGLAVKLSSIAIGILAFVTLVATREIYFQSKIVHRLKSILQGQDIPATERIPKEQLEAIFPELSMGLSGQNLKAKTLANRADMVWRRFSQQAPKLGPSIALLAVYGGVVLLGAVGAVGLLAAHKASNEKVVIVRRMAAGGKIAPFEEIYWNQHKIWEGQLTAEGLYDGPSTSWTSNGVKQLDGFWVKGFAQGDWTTYDTSGKIKSIVTYDKGRPYKYQIAQNGFMVEVKAEDCPQAAKLGIQTSPKGVHIPLQSN